MRSAVRRRHRRTCVMSNANFSTRVTLAGFERPSQRGPLLQDLRSPSSQPAAAGAARLARREPADRRAGARAARARERHSLERSFGRPPARVAAPGPRRVLRRAPHRHHPRRLLLSGNRRVGRSPAAARVRAALASEAARAAAARYASRCSWAATPKPTTSAREGRRRSPTRCARAANIFPSSSRCPIPVPRNRLWLKNNAWFEREVAAAAA